MTALPVHHAPGAGTRFTAMNADDIDAVLALEQRNFAFPWTRGNFIDSLRAGYSTWLMREDEHMLGYAVMMLVLDEAHLLNISILPERQRTGLGSMLLQHLFEEARGQGVARIYLEVRQSNHSGCGFYLHHGFAQIGERADYYPARNGREAALVLEKNL